MNNSICVIIRVYNRIEDLELNLKLIRETWRSNNYFIIVSCNGESDGFLLTDFIKNQVDYVVSTTNNSGHLKGNSILLHQAIPYIPDNCQYTLLLEADTWLYNDELICKYVDKLKLSNSVWASAKWYDRFYSLATDFAIVNTDFLLKNEKIFDFGNYPETYVATYLHENNASWIHIKENMPVQIAGYIKRLPYAPYGRFYVYPFSNMATHHIEHFKDGMNRKKRDFNALSNNFFEDSKVVFPILLKIWMKCVVAISLLFPRRSWFRKNEFRDEIKIYNAFS